MSSLIDPALRRRFAGGLALNAGAALAGAAPAAVTAWALTQVAQGADGRALASTAALWLAALLAVQLLATVFGGRLGFAAGLAAVHCLRRRVLTHALALPPAVTRRLGNGALAALLVEDARWVPEFSGYGLPRLLAHAVAAAALAGALVWLLPAAGLAIVAGLALAAAGTVLFDRALHRLAGTHAAAFRAAGSALLAHLRGLIVLRAFGAAAERIGLGRRAIDDLERRARARLWPTLAAGRLAPLALDLAPLPLLLLALAAADAPAALAVPCLILGLELLRLLHLAHGDLPLLRLCRMAARRLAAFLARAPLPVAAPAQALPAARRCATSPSACRPAA